MLKITWQKTKAAFKGAAAIWQRAEGAFGSLVGQADYDEYLEHFKKHHKDKEPLNRREFYEQCNDDRGKRPRCC